MIRCYSLFLLFLLLVPAINYSEEAVESTQQKAIPNAQCLRCHKMETLAYRDRATGNIVNLHVSELKFENSNHRNLTCVTCHKQGFEKYPHLETEKQEQLYCLDCHKEDATLKPYQFEKIENEFLQSVHAQKQPENFSCFSCHDAHEFLSSRTALQKVRSSPEQFSNEKDSSPDKMISRREILKIVAYDNAICLSCHDKPEQLQQLSPSTVPKFRTAHDWLPNNKLHWIKVRCIDCHLAEEEQLSHRILPADKALKNCVKCHSTDSLLLSKLYLYSKDENRQKFGFTNSIIMNDAYIIGMTRNVLLEKLSFILLGITVSGIFLHGLGRWLTRHRRQR